jgi:hypothetical protein
MNDLQNQSLDFCRTGLNAMLDMMTASLEATQRLRTHQVATITQALAENAQLAAQAKNSPSPNDLMTVSAALAANQYKTLAAYWSGIYRVVGENQMALHQQGQAQIIEMQRQLAASLDVTANGGPEPVLESVKATVTAISAGLGTWARAAADSATFAAAHVYPGNGGSQPAAATAIRTEGKQRAARESQASL